MHEAVDTGAALFEVLVGGRYDGGTCRCGVVLATLAGRLHLVRSVVPTVWKSGA